jgi:hypothetical protein
MTLIIFIFAEKVRECVGAKMEHGPRRAMSCILVLNGTAIWIWATG